jgi:hypothetical protein
MISRMKANGLWISCFLVLAACAADEPAPDPGPEAERRVPATLDHLVLAEDLAIITPVRFPHRQHSDPAVMGEIACARCHHPLKDDPSRIPAPCGSCHVPEDEPHDHEDPPDI